MNNRKTNGYHRENKEGTAWEVSAPSLFSRFFMVFMVWGKIKRTEGNESVVFISVGYCFVLIIQAVGVKGVKWGKTPI